MAYFIRETGDSLTPKEHSDTIFKNYLQRNELKGMTGKPGSGQVFIVDDSFKVGKGDTKQYHFVPQNETDGLIGQDVTVSGNEESLDEYSMEVTVNEVNKAFAKKGKLTDLRTVVKLREEFKVQLTNWYSQRNEIWTFDAATGYISNGMTYANTLANLAAPSCTTQMVYGEGRIIIAKGGDSFEYETAANSSNYALLNSVTSTLGTDDKMNTILLDELEIIAKQGNSSYRIEPIRVGDVGQEYFVLYLDIRAYRDLKQEAEFKKYMLSLTEAGLANNPFASGALGVWNNIIIKKSERIRRFQDSSGKYYARNLLMGANSVLTAWAQTLDYVEKEDDYKRFMGVNASEIRGMTKFKFNGVDLGVCQVVTAAN